MKFNLALLMGIMFVLSGCSYGLKYIDKNKKGSSDWEVVESGKKIK